MMRTRTLKSSPSILALYARSAVAMLPGTSLLPLIPGAGKEIPELELTLPGVKVKPAEVAAYAKVCGFSLRDELPVTFPHVLAFPLHMAIMADGSFPFGAVGLVHIENRIIQRRAIGLSEELEIRVRPTALEPHPRGRAFSLLTEVLAGGEPVWESTSRMLRRGGGKQAASTATPRGSEENPSDSSAGDSAAGGTAPAPAELEVSSEWRLSGDLGRRYAAVSGDRNPIHMHALSAKAFGFPRAIAHGMWTKARCLAALESRLPEALSVEVRFRKPILLPSRVQFASASRGQQIEFAVRDAKRGTPHLEGNVMPLEAKQTSTRSN
jgi:acyl dehydratase